MRENPYGSLTRSTLAAFKRFHFQQFSTFERNVLSAGRLFLHRFRSAASSKIKIFSPQPLQKTVRDKNKTKKKMFENDNENKIHS